MWYTIKSWFIDLFFVEVKENYPFEICAGVPVDSQRDLASFTVDNTLYTIYIKKV